MQPDQPAITADPVRPDERISRFVLDRGHFTTERVKFRAFLPPQNNTPDGLVLSVGRTCDLNEAEVWAWGDDHVANPGGRTVFARGDFTLELIQEVAANGITLGIVPNEPPPRHGNITGWPPFDRKELRASLAQQLAAKAQLVRR